MKRTVIDDLISNLKRIKPETILQRSVTSEALEAAEDINRYQLEQGELQKGTIMNNYAKKTEEIFNPIRETKISRFEEVKFKDSGQFYKSIKAKVNKNVMLEMSAKHRNAKHVFEYIEDKGIRDSPLGLQDQWLENWIETFVQPYFVKGIQDRLLTQ